MQNERAEKIILAYRDHIYRIAFSYVKNPYDADDIVQIVSLKLLRYDGEFESEEHIKRWLIRVTVNECRRLLTAPFFTRHVSLEDYAKTLSFPGYEHEELFLEVMKLPAKYRVVIHLFYNEELSVREIAAALNISETAVTSRLQRARKKMKQNLEVWEDGRTEI